MNIKLDHIDERWKTEGINLIYFGDMHHRAKAPSSRIDNFEETEKNKVDQLRYLAKTFNAKAFLQPGDFLDTPAISEQLINKIMDWWGFNDFKETRKQYDAGEISKLEYADKVLDYVPIVGIIGNHELYGNSLKSFNRTTLNFLDQRGFIQLVDKTTPYIIKGDNGLTVAITGNHFDIPVNKYSGESDITYYEQPNKYGDVDIYLLHGYLAGTEIRDPYSVLATDLTTEADITISGHIHDGFDWVEIDGKYFGNPGAIAQQSTAQSELDRTVNATLIHIEDSGEFYIVDIPLDLPKTEELFNMDEKDSRIQNEKRIERIKTIIDSVDSSSGTNTAAIIKAVAEEENIPKDIRDLALEKTYEKMQEMGANDPLDPNVDYRVKSITLHNFESHQHTVIDLDPTASPTLVIGESSQGKSSILRGVYWVLENSGDVKSFVRRKKNVRDAYVELERMDGTKVRRYVEVSISRATGELRPRKNGYIITNPNGEEAVYNTGGVTIAQEIFGMNYLQLDDKESIPINFQKQEDGWYFIGLTDGQRAKVIGALYGTQYISSAIKSLNRDSNQLNQEVKFVDGEIKDVREELDTLKHIDQIETDYQKLQKDIDKLSRDDSKYDSMVEVYNEWFYANKDYDNYQSFIKLTKPTLTDAQVKFSNLQSRNTVLTELERELDNIQSSTEVLNQAERYKAIDINGIKERYNKLSDLDKSYSLIVESYKELSEYQSEFNKLQRLVNHKESIQSTEQSLSTLLESEGRYNQMREVFNERLTHDKELSKLKESISGLKEKVKELQTELTAKRRGLFSYKDFGIVKVYTPGGENNMDLKKISAQIDKLNNDLIVAETQSKTAEKQIEASNKKLKELGINPDNARAEILAFKETMEEEYNTLVESLDKIEQDLQIEEV